MINIYKINNFLKNLLDPESMADVAINGIQVGNDGSEVSKIAFTVDASYAAIEKAAEEKSNLLITHHGIFWGKVEPITGAHRNRIKRLLDANIGLISYHLPLDAHSEYGNNIQIIKKLGVRLPEKFAPYKGNQIGYIGNLDKTLRIDEIASKMGLDLGAKGVNYLGFGINDIKKIAVVSGGAGDNVFDAIRLGADLFITGDSCHELYHVALENKINVLFAGHYFSETFGVKALMKKIEEEFGLQTAFLDIPTGL
ncbi:MAG TPA: Nif3-like dinuclear metal center hexameric protein [Spirochaetota bacterium]|nr:Nif3-like dinuclear metal center hexameric protein [Spirochaetota bacterium]HOS32756.1 Nif3-like dinuclear metal center hexameric protein [Spirochaetota bacterium]HOS55277.1 Nif3-like dinuclear metal center hexameric protein [Spirochaetota bacterium]HPK62345.1 Nif3-like dinuclear metal center hexameric protein [Spirochaetota bacterium]HQF77848.1 Nif3-like dinuclear metal center hexameric protein [Spirochaetota bacterium]